MPNVRLRSAKEKRGQEALQLECCNHEGNIKSVQYIPQALALDSFSNRIEQLMQYIGLVLTILYYNGSR